MKTTFAHWFLLFTVLSLVSCRHQSKRAEAIFSQVESIVDLYPDSALQLLDSIHYPYELNKSQYAQYILRSVQAKHKAERDITTDTLIFRARDYYAEKSEPNNLALSLFYCGVVLQANNRNEEAAKMYLEAGALADKVKNINLSILADCYIGMLNYEQYFFEEARVHFKRANRKSATANGKYENAIRIKTHIANSFILEQALDSALFYYSQGLEIAEHHHELGDQININQMMSVAFLGKGDIAFSKEAIMRALSLSDRANNTERLSEIYLSLSNVYQEENQVDSALYYTNLALLSSKRNSLDVTIYESISGLEESRGNYKESLKYLRLFANYADSLYSQKQEQSIMEVQKKYNYELIQNANRQLIIEKLWITIALVASALLFIIILFSVYGKRAANKEALLLAKQQIYQLKEIVSTKDKKEDENSEIEKKLRIALVDQLDIIKKVSLLEGFLNDGNDTKVSGKAVLQKVNKIIYKSTDNLNWSAFFQSVNALYDDYLIRLVQVYPSLTEDEVLLCCLLKTGLSNEEIRLLLKSTPNIVQKRKSSIREKTGMKKQEHFIKQLDELIKREQ